MLKDKVAVVTGAGRGIGREIAKTFAGYGAKVVVNFNGSEERANSLVEEIKAAGGEAVAFKANVADFAEAEALIEVRSCYIWKNRYSREQCGNHKRQSCTWNEGG